MTEADQFSPVEWTILTELPIRVLASAMRADETSELGLLIQQATGLTALSSRANEYASSELVQHVFEHYKSHGDGEAQTLQLSEQWIERLIPDTIERARQATEILANKAGPDDAASYKLWLLETAAAVCAAARTGGFLGIGGERISEKEQAYLDDLAAAFEIPAENE
ncbi:MAG: hypothetical protein E6R14_02520 [Thermomicrobiales bacterium]|nr:MAG: hypothetical protein E6R14_02520 [Thermomicrobiales bacterium]